MAVYQAAEGGASVYPGTRTVRGYADDVKHTGQLRARVLAKNHARPRLLVRLKILRTAF